MFTDRHQVFRDPHPSDPRQEKINVRLKSPLPPVAYEPFDGLEGKLRCVLR